MNISRPVKLFVLALTVWPVLYLIGFIAAMSYVTPENFDTLFALHVATMLETIGLLVFYIVHLFKTNHVPAANKALWGICLFMGSCVAMPIYWFMHVWPERAEPGAWSLDSVVPPRHSPEAGRA